jgi:hypothetical protein
MHSPNLVPQRAGTIQQFGFDFSVEEIEGFIAGRQAVRNAINTLDEKRVNWAAGECSRAVELRQSRSRLRRNSLQNYS